jgi:cbb3-type cytochrome oxidase subunit 1
MATSHSATYNDKVVRQFAIAAVVWGVVGMTVGVLIASQLAWPELNFGIPWLSYSRLRPLHTNAVIFAFGCSALIATSLLRGTAYLPGHGCLAGPLACLRVLGLAGNHPRWP